MARDWRELFITDGAASTPEEAPDEQQTKRRGFFRRLRENMSKTRSALAAEVQATLFENLDEETWERLEEALIMADVGAKTTAEIVMKLEAEAESGKIEGGEALTQRLTELLAEVARVGDEHIDVRPHPTVLLMVGVNGTGKTTTLGKLSHHLKNELGLNVVLGAADTFRAAAVEQLEGWAKRADVPIVTPSKEGQDPGSVAFDTVKRGLEEGADVILIDTAGRLHTQDNLMAELTKIRKVISKQLEGAPHETLLTVDSTTGQNGLRQAKLFSDAVQVDGIVLTKLDGTAKGGIVVLVQRELGVPVKLVGLGEGPDDLAPFDPKAFVDAVLD